VSLSSRPITSLLTVHFLFTQTPTHPVQKILMEGWSDTDGTDLWDYTWKQTAKAAPGLTSALLTGGSAADRVSGSGGH
jgi:hypothetical protein